MARERGPAAAVASAADAQQYPEEALLEVYKLEVRLSPARAHSCARSKVMGGRSLTSVSLSILSVGAHRH